MRMKYWAREDDATEGIQEEDRQARDKVSRLLYEIIISNSVHLPSITRFDRVLL